jgi:hypothetical protein
VGYHQEFSLLFLKLFGTCASDLAISCRVDLFLTLIPKRGRTALFDFFLSFGSGASVKLIGVTCGLHVKLLVQTFACSSLSIYGVLIRIQPGSYQAIISFSTSPEKIAHDTGVDSDVEHKFH